MTAEKPILYQTVNKIPLSLPCLIVTDRGRLVKPVHRRQKLELLLLRLIFHMEKHNTIHNRIRAIRIELAIINCDTNKAIEEAKKLNQKVKEFNVELEEKLIRLS